MLMSDSNNWADAQQEKLERINELLNEIISTHKKMQSLLTEAAIKTQVERGLKEIECFLEDAGSSGI